MAFFISFEGYCYVKIQVYHLQQLIFMCESRRIYILRLFNVHKKQNLVLLKRRSDLKMIKKHDYRKIWGWNFNFYT